MLVLTRKPNEAITIGDDVRIEVLSVAGQYIKIGVTAPRHIRVLREEIVGHARPKQEGDGA